MYRGLRPPVAYQVVMTKFIELIYTGTCDSKGAIAIPKRARKEIASVFAGKNLEVRIRVAFNVRTDMQNKYYWGVIIVEILQAFIDLGNEGLFSGSTESKLLIHEFLKSKFLPPIEVANAMGEAERIPGSTRKLTKAEFMDYIESIKRWAAECLFINISDPGEQLELWNEN